MKLNTPSDQAKIAALHENRSHLRYVMRARLLFTSIHAAVIAILFSHLLEGDFWIIIFGYLITIVGIIYVIRESNAVDNYQEKISILADELRLRKTDEGGQDYLAIHLDRELPENFWWKNVFRVRTAFVLYYSCMIAIVTEFLLRRFSIPSWLHILIFVLILGVSFFLLRHASETFERGRNRKSQEKQVCET